MAPASSPDTTPAPDTDVAGKPPRAPPAGGRAKRVVLLSVPSLWTDLALDAFGAVADAGGDIEIVGVGLSRRMYAKARGLGMEGG
jgi:hypothetical protein